MESTKGHEEARRKNATICLEAHSGSVTRVKYTANGNVAVRSGVTDSFGADEVIYYEETKKNFVFLRVSPWILFLVVSAYACTTLTPLDPLTAQSTAQSAWKQSWHGTWELTWPASPITGPIIFEGWHDETLVQRRYEILEANTPSLIGLTYINDGTLAQHFNRLEPTVPPASGDSTLPFSPITDAFDKISALLAQPPQSATQKAIELPQGPGLELTVNYAQSQTLTLWLDTTHNLITKATLESPNTRITLVARTLVPLNDVHPDLFSLNDF